MIQRVRIGQRIRQVEEAAVLVGGYFRLRENLPRSGERGVEAEKQARATQEASVE